MKEGKLITPVPFSSGSSVEGHFYARGGISIDFMEMNKIVAFHPEE
jgi:D-lactate dehydrogenase (cytochrome)